MITEERLERLQRGKNKEKSCKTCGNFDKRSNSCKVFYELIENCPAWTDDADYIKKIDALAESYAGYLKIRQYLKKFPRRGEKRKMACK